MLLDLLERLPALRLILASASPRRRDILTSIIGPAAALEIIPSTFIEDLPKGDSAVLYVQLTARKKAEDVVAKLAAAAPLARLATATGSARKDFVLISTDTVVVRDNRILEKPADEAHAYAMLSSLSGGKHSVVSGVTVVTSVDISKDSPAASTRVELPKGFTVEPFSVGSDGPLYLAQFATQTTVEFAHIPDSVLRAYVKSAEPYDKAGGYGIQSLAGGAQFVRSLEGCYYNVMGLPLFDLCSVLRHIILLQQSAESKGDDTDDKG